MLGKRLYKLREMNNLIKDITNNNIPVSQLLRKAKVLAIGLDQPNFSEWVMRELNGYGDKDKYPDYRKVSGEVKFWNPSLGWCPIVFSHSKVEKQIATRGAKQSVAEIEELLSDKSSSYEMPYPASVAQSLMEDAPIRTKVSLFIGRVALKGILDAVRNSLLDWMFKFKNEGMDSDQGSFIDLEASQILKIISLLEYKLRKTIRSIPAEEKEIQDAFENLLIGADISYSRETDSIEYSSKTYTPDFSVEKEDLAIEVKLCNKKEREKQIIPEINDDILAYRIKYKNAIFVVYDTGFIRDIERFSKNFEDQDGIVVKVIKH